jgi:hypothetical protein
MGEVRRGDCPWRTVTLSVQTLWSDSQQVTVTFFSPYFSRNLGISSTKLHGLWRLSSWCTKI